jgi:excisionase family DNA binding protein
VLLSLSIVVLCACKAQAQTPIPLQTITAPQGSKIVYGTVAGATTQAAAMSSVLRNVHNNCGEKPQVGQVFQFKGMNSVGVFFTVTNHPGGNKKVAGLVIANATGPEQVDAAPRLTEGSCMVGAFGETGRKSNVIQQAGKGEWLIMESSPRSQSNADKKPEIRAEEKLLLSRRDAAQVLSISQRALDYLVANQRLPSRRIGKRVLIPVADLRKFARADHPEPIAG